MASIRPARRTFAILAILLAFCSAQNLTSSKRGLCYVASSHSSSDDSIWTSSGSDLTWYYNYQASPTSSISGSSLQFVPMQWGAPTSDTDMTFFNTVQGLINGGQKIPYVLGFNEPDGCVSGGSCISAQLAAQTWIREVEPLKKQYGVRLGAPAVTGSPMGFVWLQSFFTACAGNCTPDFIPVHFYGSFEGLASHIGQVNATYPNMTMWVTEYAYANVTLQESQSFYNQSEAFLDRLSYVTHYSYFGAFRSDVSNVGPDAAMLTQKGQLTDIGAWYLGQRATGNVPKGGSARSVRFAGWAVVVAAVCLWAAN
ncbi:glycoside hydrolase family 128 protein [Baudoinia panamericana UAMH 10762]|uniref:Glycoside hydrolase family 128 protein n=1 Tax=Baudoinia panamericana (strain UAMH 10762) TaxID=717646 RepID=M2MGG3_BAUPA|nr:glycoside hydrolase family 128 protein [Baudoinia panamericana UAMH 10762]EMC95721.1 glycoside hydrolase family 128 protein [Baudoinia panamericana UAMH 10762]